MATVTIDINNRCGRKCRCTQNRQFLSGSIGTVGSTSFRYCTHRATGGAKISDATWNGAELEVLRYVDQFRDSTDITVFYHGTHGIKYGFIKKPLLVKVKKPYGKIYWYENLGSYANKKWRRLGKSESEKYPEEEKYVSSTYLEAKLQALTCRLHISHAIHIYPVKNEHEINCTICNTKEVIKIEKESLRNVSGYVKHTYKDIVDGCVLVYNGNPISFRKRSSATWLGYFIPIQLDAENVKKVSLYYWDGDTKFKNPLLLEIVGTNGISYWLENFSKDEKGGESKHDKWRYIDPHKPGGKLDDNTNLQNRLNLLNCIYNGTVQIHIGKSECHPKHYLHKNRIGYGYGEVFGTYPVIYSYKYRPSLSSDKKFFNVSEAYVNGLSQNFQDKSPPFVNVTNFTAYVSPCDPDMPFLLCVESTGAGGRSEYNWYERKDNNGNWKKRSFPGRSQLSPKDAKRDIVEIFGQIRGSFQLQECHIRTSSQGVKLDIRKTVDSGKSTIYWDNTSIPNKSVPIFVTKSREDVVSGFFQNSHRPATNNDTFVVQQQLVGGNTIGASSKIPGVEKFYVYFWDGEPNDPILIGVRRSLNTPILYGKGPGGETWMSSQVYGLEEQQALDHQTCKLHDAIPIDLTDPTNLGRFKSNISGHYPCIQNGLVRQSRNPSLPKGAQNVYEAKTYQVEKSKRISRVTYNGQPTNIIPPYTDFGIIINIYRWNKTYAPLIVEFKGNKNHEWYENLGFGKEHKNWKKIEKNVSREFYNLGTGGISELNEKFTKKLNEVNCKLHGVIQLDISQKNGSYCHGITTGHEKRIKVTPQSKSTYPGFVGYVHETAILSQTTFVISSFYNGNTKQEVSDLKLPLEHVKKVTVYFPVCVGGTPIAIHIEQNKVADKWLKRVPSKNIWEEATKEFKDGATINNILEDIKNNIKACDMSENPPPEAKKQSLVPGKVPKPLVKSDEEDPGKFTLTSMFTDLVDMEGDNDDPESDLVNNEHESEDIKNEIAEVTFLNTDISQHSSHAGNPPIVSLLFSPPEITIDIRRDIYNGKLTGSSTYTVGLLHGNGQNIELDKTEDPSHSGFYRLTHSLTTGQPFKVEKVMFDDTSRDEIRPQETINSYSVWYWSGDSQMTEPLLIEIEKEDYTYKYYSSKGNWSGWNNPSGYKDYQAQPLQEEDLETQLDDINCQLNDAATMDLSYEKSTRLIPYCCGESKSFGEKYRLLDISYFRDIFSKIHNLRLFNYDE